MSCCKANFTLLTPKIAKSDISFVVSVHLSVRVEQLCSHWTDFYEIWYFSIFRKYVEKIQVSLKSDRVKGTLYEDQYTIMIISRSVVLRMINVFDKVVDKIKTRILCSINFSFWKSCRLWDNVEKYFRAGQATDDNVEHAHCMLDT